MAQLRPRDVLTQHGDLAEMLGDGTRPLGEVISNIAKLDKLITQGDIGSAVARHLMNARPYLIAEHMLPLIWARATSMDDLTKVGDDIPPPRACGFAVLEAPMDFTELRGRRTLIHALVWGPARDQRGTLGWIMAPFNDILREPDEIGALDADNPTLRRMIGRWHPGNPQWLPRGRYVGPKTYEPSEEERARIAAEGDSAYATFSVPRLVLALWAVLDETVSTHTTERGDRASTRLAARRHLPTEITVITLRREAEPVQNPGSGTPLDHRVWVEEHRRRYWCGHGPEKHLEWRNVGGHWRGPEDGLVVDRPKVNRLAR